MTMIRYIVEYTIDETKFCLTLTNEQRAYDHARDVSMMFRVKTTVTRVVEEIILSLPLE
jgi:hypothetical protein